jgi:2-desacetyl-2-hydroxyethyl bacteriochlorophyllide A dehydrogenase
MKAAVFYGPRDVKVEEVEMPKIQDNEILIKVKACGICGSDLHMYKLGLFSDSLCRPLKKGGIPGHEFSGDVVKVGRKVRRIKEGDRIAAFGHGAMAEYIPVPYVRGFTVHKLPPEVSYEEAATLEPLANSVHATLKPNPSKGENVVIFGIGAIGLGIIQCINAFELGLNKVIAVDISDYRLKLAMQLGVDGVVNANTDDPFEKIVDFVGSIPLTIIPTISIPKVDIVYDCVGYIKDHPGIPVIQQAINMARDFKGRVVVHGLYEKNVSLDLQPLVGKQISILGSFGCLPSDVKQALELIQTKKIDRSKIISHEFSLDQAKEGFETQCNVNESVKVLIKP